MNRRSGGLLVSLLATGSMFGFGCGERDDEFPVPDFSSSQRIEISSPSPLPTAGTVGQTFEVAAAATSSLPVTMEVGEGSPGVCVLEGSTLSLVGVGECLVVFRQEGDSNWRPATNLWPLVVAQGQQTIAFTSSAPETATIGGAPYEVTAVSSAGLPVVVTVDESAAAICSIDGAMVSFTARGACVLNANAEGNANFAAAAQVQQNIAVGGGIQVINFTSPVPSLATVGGLYTPAANVTPSGLPVVFTIDAASSAVCLLSGGDVNFTAVGTCTINANVAADGIFDAAAQVQMNITVREGQALLFTSTAPTPGAVGATYQVTAQSNSMLAVTLTSASPMVCTIDGSGLVTFVAAGTCLINANQAGDADFAPAPEIQQSITVSAEITIEHAAPPDAAMSISGAQTARQTFTVGSAGSITSVAVNMIMSGAGGTPQATYELYATSSGLPTGTALATSPLIAADGFNSVWELTSPLAVTPGLYAIVVTAGSGNGVDVNFTTGDIYTEGAAILGSTPSGSVDYNFRVTLEP